MTKTTQRPTQTIPIVLKNTSVASNALPPSTQRGRLAIILGKQQLTGFCFGYWAGGSGAAPRSFSGGHGAHCSPCFRPGQPPLPTSPRAQNTPTDPQKNLICFNTYLWSPLTSTKTDKWIKNRSPEPYARLTEDNGKFPGNSEQG